MTSSNGKIRTRMTNYIFRPAMRISDLSFQRPLVTALAFGLVATVVRVCISQIVYNPVDYFVYWNASPLLLSGQDIYANNIYDQFIVPDGLPFVYPPLAALVIAPFSWLPRWPSFALWTLVNSTAIAWSCMKVIGLSELRRGKVFNLSLVAVLLLASSVSAQHLIFGQINAVLMAMCVAGLLSFRGAKQGVLVGIAASMKITPALFVVFQLATRRYKAALVAIATGLVVIAMSFLVFPTSSRSYFFGKLLNLSESVELDGFFATSGNSSIQGALARLTGIEGGPIAWLLVAGALVLGLTASISLERYGQHTWAVLLVGITACLVSPVSWIHHWVYLLPLCAFSLNSSLKSVRKSGWLILVVLLAQVTDLGDFVSRHTAGWLAGALSEVLRSGIVITGLVLILVALSFCLKSRKAREQ